MSRSRMLLQSQGDPIFGLSLLGGLIFKGAKALIKRGAKRASTTLPVGTLGAGAGIIAKSKTAILKRLGRLPGRRIAVAGAGAVATGAAFGVGERLIRGPGGELISVPRRRRMNALNPKALRRATRRLSSFNKTVQRTQKELRKLAPPRRSTNTAAARHHRGDPC